VAGDRPAHERPAGLDAHARPGRQRPALVAPPASTPPLLRGCPALHDRPASHPPHRLPLAVDRRNHHSSRTAHSSAEARLTSDFTSLRGAPPLPEQWNPAPTRGDTRAVGLPGISLRKRNGPPTESADRQDRSRPATRAALEVANRAAG
jgi:hypothetical protein